MPEKSSPTDPLIEIQDPEIDLDRLHQQLREQIRQRRERLGLPVALFPTFEGSFYPGEPQQPGYDSDLYFHLRRSNETATQLRVDVRVVPSALDRIPLLGTLVRKIKEAGHRVAVFYVQDLAHRQGIVNRHLIGTLNRMALQLQKQEEEIARLRAELSRLQARQSLEKNE